MLTAAVQKSTTVSSHSQQPVSTQNLKAKHLMLTIALAAQSAAAQPGLVRHLRQNAQLSMRAANFTATTNLTASSSPSVSPASRTPTPMTGVNDCDFDTDCGSNGFCDLVTSPEFPEGAGVCECDSGYLTTNDAVEPCDYKQKSYLTTVLLSWFAGATGADRFYAANGNPVAIATAAMKLGLLVPGSCVLPLLGYYVGGAVGGEEGAAIGATIAKGFLGLAIPAWHLTDAIAYTVGTFKDGNGMPLSK